MNEPSSPDSNPVTVVTDLLGGDSGFTIHSDRVTVLGPPRIDVSVGRRDGSIELSYTTDVGSERAQTVRTALADVRPPVRADTDEREGRLSVRLSALLDADDLTRHRVRAALHEMAHVVERAGLEESAVADDREATRVLERAWRPTHRVPAGGLPTWPRPDGSGPPEVRLEARVELAVAESRGDWARVVGENGWTGWLDARRLESLAGGTGPASSPPPSPKPARAGRPAGEASPVLPLVALLLLGSSSLLPWLDTPDGERLNALEVPLAFLWDASAAEAPHLGWAILAVALATIPLIVWGRARLAFIPIGLAGLAIPLFFVAQVFRATFDAGSSAGEAVGVLGLAPLAATVAGSLLLASARR